MQDAALVAPEPIRIAGPHDLPDWLPRIIAISGPIDAGKSTLADLLTERWSCVPIHLADPIKAMLAAMYRCVGLDEETIRRKLHGDLKEAPCDLLRGETPRRAMRTLGEDWGREIFGAAFWIGLWANRAALPVNPIVVGDLRREDEASWVRHGGGVVVEVRRSGVAYRRDHPTEMGVSPDIRVLNIEGRPEAMLAQLQARLIALHPERRRALPGEAGWAERTRLAATGGRV